MTRTLPKQPTFADWYRAIHGREPFPWQSRLANHVTDNHGWPNLVGIPTGLGKTACVDIAIWALSSQADVPPAQRTAPIRLWWVVNRRLLVDETYKHASRLADMLTKAADGPLARVASRLNHIAGHPHSRPLEVMRLRGETERRRPSTPAQPAVLCSTIPMFGSRILFRGYGTSRSMRPIDAALAYTDSLVIIDEAHLAVHLQNLLNGLKDLDTAEVPILPKGRRSPVVVALTATGDAEASRFDLDSRDHDHPEIQKRLHADKPIRLLELSKATTENKRVDGIVSAAKDLLVNTPPGVTLVFVNRPATAIKTASKLRNNRYLSNSKVIVATGQIRGYETKKVTLNILDRARSGQSTVLERHLIIVTTQTLEVGADIDADYLITEACGVRALTQRLGRLNRIGDRPHAKGVYIHTPPERTGSWPLYGEEPSTVIIRMQAHLDNGVVRLPPARVANVLGPPQDQPDRAPVIAPGILWEWIKTSTPPPGEAPVNPYFAGVDDPERRVSIAWRAYLPKGNEKLWPRIQEEELIDAFVVEADKFLEELDDDQYVLLNSDRITVTSYSEPRSLRPGDTILIRSDAGGLDEDGHWRPDLKDRVRVVDVSVFRAGIPIDKEAIEQIYNGELSGEARTSINKLLRLVEEIDVDYEDIEKECTHLVNSLAVASPPGINKADWENLIDSMRKSLDKRISQNHSALIQPRDEVPRLPLDNHHQRLESIVVSDEQDERSLSNGSIGLAEHGNDTAEWATSICNAIGITKLLSHSVVKAAQLHDIGKSDPRFQRWLDPGHQSTGLLAKSKTPTSRWARDRVAAGWPPGGRHEEISRRIVQAWLHKGNHEFNSQEAELLQHLVVSHHGNGRPLITPILDNSCGEGLAYDIEGIQVSVIPDLSSVDWDQPSRFALLNKLYGSWGLALLETIVRQSDHRASQYGSTLEKK